MNGYNFSDASDIKLGSSTITALYYGSTLIWPKTSPTIDWSTEYLQIEALEPMILTNGRPATADSSIILDIKYSTDKINWNNWNEDISLSLVAGDKVYFKGSYLSTFTSVSNLGNSRKYQLCYGYKTPSNAYANYTIQGNIMSLIYGDNFVGQTSLQGYSYCFHRLFEDNDSITDMSNLILPATTLAERCYNIMFQGCALLVTPPILPATILADYCYSGMFGDCSALTTAPELPATTLANYCYSAMFATCTSLTTAPELLAATLVEGCYTDMFGDCSLLNYIKCLATDISASMCLYNWVQNVSANGTFIKDNNTTYNTGRSGIPSGWTVQNAS